MLLCLSYTVNLGADSNSVCSQLFCFWYKRHKNGFYGQIRINSLRTNTYMRLFNFETVSPVTMIVGRSKYLTWSFFCKNHKCIYFILKYLNYSVWLSSPIKPSFPLKPKLRRNCYFIFWETSLFVLIVGKFVKHSHFRIGFFFTVSIFFIEFLLRVSRVRTLSFPISLSTVKDHLSIDTPFIRIYIFT